MSSSTARSSSPRRCRPTPEREHDVVLFGATGFTGGLTAEYLAGAAGRDGTRWALAGRSQSRLEAVRDRLGVDVPLLVADVGDAASVRRVAESARVVITTVGPYINYGEPVVAACAAAGTDYVDLTGEPEFVDLMWLRYHEQAARSGARLVHSCGFDSIPYDLGALYTVGRLPEGVPIRLEGFVRAGGTFSGGTYHSAVHAMGRLRQSTQVAGQRRRREARPEGRRVRGETRPPHRDDLAGGWVLPFPTIDPQTVLRSARALDRYGPDFTYAHYLAVRRLPVLAGLVAGAAGVIALAQLPPTRDLLLKLKDPGEGPTPEQREKAWFKVRFRGEGGGRSIVTEVTGGDPGYGETSKMLAESALCLAHDELPGVAGQVTPAVAMGQALIDRLRRAGIGFEVVEGG
ncbi:MAG TPA: saccharopine dehydrogenase NADP-binding domain-containing protein [Solirubrobacteraceae bacterium]|nr:saccharopine dehydrogenase NADP-binding domain-containing protein [Solirubrobacteraceae bacterium]